MNTSSLYSIDDVLNNSNEIENCYYNEYIIYKRKIFIFINNDINNILNIYDNEFVKNMIKIFILKKKNKITENDYILLKQIFDMIENLNKLDFIDQNDAIDIFLFFYKIYMDIPNIKKYFEHFKFRDLVNIEYMINNITNAFNIILNNNNFYIFLSKLDKIKTNENCNIEDLIKQFIKAITYDFFMYYTSEIFYDKIINFTLYINNLHTMNILKKYKNLIIKEYEKYFKKYSEIYFLQEVDLKIKFKFNKNNLLENIINEINIIKTLD